jgi:Rha family phage regulatory protein
MLALSNFGLVEKNGVPVVSSRYIADTFGKEHKDVLEVIRKATEFNSGLSENFRQRNFTPSSYKNEQNKKQPEYLLTRDGFSYIAMGFTGKKAAQFKEAYINAFNQMETFIKDLVEAKADFPEFTDAILASHEEPKHYHFSNECSMINKIVLGVDTKKYRELQGIEAGKSIRPYLAPEQLKLVKMLQKIDIGLIYSTPDFQERKRILEKQYQRLVQKAISA